MMRRTPSRALALAFAAVGCNASPESATPGHETGPCADGLCLAGLVCASDVCVALPGGDGSGTGGGIPPLSTGDASTTSTVTSPSGSDGSTATADETRGAGEGSGSTSVADTGRLDDSTGEPAPDFALRFDGPNRATSSPVLFDAPEYTVEAWIEILQENAQGAILSQQLDQHGYLLAIVPGSLNVVFTPWDEDMGFISVVAGTAPEVGIGWHHLAATQVDGELTMYLDGIAVDSQPVPPVSTVDAEITIGHNQNLPNWHLSGVVVDDVRITMHARYTEDFDPPVSFVDDGDVFLLIDLDEGAGATATDEAQGIVFDLEQPTWVSGHAG